MVSFKDVIVKHPELPIQKAVKGMLPKNVLGRQLITKLKVYGTQNHPHKAQQPEQFAL
jgi:large subunit ribosomal protein L13